jgi:hypothetical protein
VKFTILSGCAAQISPALSRRRSTLATNLNVVMFARAGTTFSAAYRTSRSLARREPIQLQFHRRASPAGGVAISCLRRSRDWRAAQLTFAYANSIMSLAASSPSRPSSCASFSSLCYHVCASSRLHSPAVAPPLRPDQPHLLRCHLSRGARSASAIRSPVARAVPPVRPGHQRGSPMDSPPPAQWFRWTRNTPGYWPATAGGRQRIAPAKVNSRAQSHTREG